MKKLYLIMIMMLSCLMMTSCNNTTNTSIENTDIFNNATVSYLGPEGTYTHEASELFFNNAKKMIPMESVDKAIESVIKNESDFAVIPQENTLGGPVTNYVDALISNSNIYIVGEVIIPISQTLMAKKGVDINNIEIIYSHAQGIIQSEKWRKANLPDAKTEEMSSTAAAANYIAKSDDTNIGAIGAPKAAEIYGLEILANDIQLSDANKTRFYVLSKEKLEGKYNNAVLVAECKADYIDDIIVKIHNADLELVSLHDRPKGDELGSYYYVIEIINDKGITDKQIDLINSIEEIRFLGCFNVIEK